MAVLSSRPLPIFLNTETTDQIFQQSGIEIPSGKYWRVQVGGLNISVHSSSEPRPDCN